MRFKRHTRYLPVLYVFLGVIFWGSAFVFGGYMFHPVKKVAVPGYCPTVEKCVRETIGLQSSQSIFGTCVKISKIRYECDFMLEDAYATKTCYLFDISIAKEGFPIVLAGNQKGCDQA